MANSFKYTAVVLLIILLLVSCSPSKEQNAEIEGSVAVSIEIEKPEKRPYKPESVVKLYAADEDFLDQSCLLPYYADKTPEQLIGLFNDNSASFLGGDSGIMNDLTPEFLIFAHGCFAYEKRTGKIMRTCKDPQCRHSQMQFADYTKCPYITGKWLNCGGTAYSNAISLGATEIYSQVFYSDFAILEYGYLDVPNGAVIAGKADDGRLVLRKEQYETYIDKNGNQRLRQGNYLILLYDPDTCGSVTVFSPGEIIDTHISKTTVYCRPISGNAFYRIYGKEEKAEFVFNSKQYLGAFDSGVLFVDANTGDIMRYDEITGEISLWAESDFPLARTRHFATANGKIYFMYRQTEEEIKALDFLTPEEKEAILNKYAQSSSFLSPILYRCNTDASDPEVVYNAADCMYLQGFLIDGDVIYTSETTFGQEPYVCAYDTSSGVQVRICVSPLTEFHYPGEYGYK